MARRWFARALVLVLAPIVVLAGPAAPALTLTTYGTPVETKYQMGGGPFGKGAASCGFTSYWARIDANTAEIRHRNGYCRGGWMLSSASGYWVDELDRFDLRAVQGRGLPGVEHGLHEWHRRGR